MSPATKRFLESLDRPMTHEHRAALTRESWTCLCGHSEYCPAHGEGMPAVMDPEVLQAFVDQSRGPRNGRVIRKPLER